MLCGRPHVVRWPTHPRSPSPPHGPSLRSKRHTVPLVGPVPANSSTEFHNERRKSHLRLQRGAEMPVPLQLRVITRGGNGALPCAWSCWQHDVTDVGLWLGGFAYHSCQKTKKNKGVLRTIPKDSLQARLQHCTVARKRNGRGSCSRIKVGFHSGLWDRSPVVRCPHSIPATWNLQSLPSCPCGPAQTRVPNPATRKSHPR